jgi:DNA polymerase-3 subunit beta
VLELTRLLGDSDELVTLQIGSNHIRVSTGDISFTSKLIDGRFPDYQRVVPQGGDKIVTTDRESLRQALTRASILSNERYRSVRFQLSSGSLRVLANNPDLEEAEEELAVDYEGGHLDVGFNANYITDALSAIDEEQVQLILSDSNSCCLMHGCKNQDSKYVVMPMRI